MNIWMIGSVRNEVDLVGPNIKYHMAQGIDRFLLLDNGSTDGTTDALRDLSRDAPLEWASCPGAFQQQELLTRLGRDASLRGADWVIPIDADEFWRSRQGTLREALQASPRGKIPVELVNFVQHRQRRYTTNDALLGMTRRVASPIGPREDTRSLVESERIAYVEHLYQRKWISNASASLEIGWGNHVVTGAGEIVRPATEFECLHAPLRSFAVLQGKVEAQRPTDEVSAYFEMAWHLRRWRRLAWENRLENEWWANSYDDDSCLDVHGCQRPLVVDDTLAAAVHPFIP